MAKRRGKPPRIPQLGNHGMDDALHAYATDLSSTEPAGLEALRRATWTQTVKPQMLCDELQGRLARLHESHDCTDPRAGIGHLHGIRHGMLGRRTVRLTARSTPWT